MKKIMFYLKKRSVRRFYIMSIALHYLLDYEEFLSMVYSNNKISDDIIYDYFLKNY